MTLLWSDIRIGLRRLRQTPAFTIAVVLTIAFGLALNTAMFGVVKGVLLDALPYPDSQRLVSVYTRFLPSTGLDFPYFALSGPEVTDLNAQVHALSVSTYTFERWNAAADGSDAERVQGVAATANLFTVLDTPAALGRTFVESDGVPGAACVAVLSDGFWRDRFAGAANVPGRTLRLDGRPCTVIGVMPPRFMFPDEQTRVWTAMALDPASPNWGRGNHYFAAVARLAPGRSLEQAEAELQLLRQRWSVQEPDHHAKGHFIVLRSLEDDLVGDLRPALFILLGAVAFVLLIVCANLAGLMLSRAEGRRREVAIRSALGAGRVRLVRQLLTEHLLIAIAGGALGVVLARGISPLVLALYVGQLPRSGALVFDGTMMAFVALMTMATGVAFGLAPALRTSKAGVQEALRADARTSTARRSSIRAQAVLVVAEVALSVVLVTGALLLLRSYAGLRQIDVGFDPEQVLSFEIFAPSASYPSRTSVQQFHAALHARVASMPGVTSAGAISNLPLQSGGPPDGFTIEGAAPPTPGAPSRNARYLMVTPGAFDTLRIPVRRGRAITDRDAAGQPLIAVISETAARMFWPNDDPIGRRIRYHGEAQPWITIVGIVGDVRSLGLNRPAPPAIYVPLAQSPRPPYEGRGMTFLVRTHADPMAIAPSVRAIVAGLDRTLPITRMRPMTVVVERAAGGSRFAAYLIAGFAVAALLLGAIGIYGVLAYAVERRRAEIGIRLALGAERGTVFRAVVGRGLMLAGIGVACGIAIALAVARMLSTLLYQVSPRDPLTLAIVPVILAVVALIACVIPARRATRVDPLVALRGE